MDGREVLRLPAQRELQLQRSPRGALVTKGFDPPEPGRGSVSQMSHEKEGGRDTWGLKQGDLIES